MLLQVWWFPKTSEQYRIRGFVLLIGDDYEDRALQISRKELWGSLSDPARESFLDDQADPPMGGRGEDGKVVPISVLFVDATQSYTCRLSTTHGSPIQTDRSTK